MRQQGAGASAAGNGSVWLNYNPADYKTLNISAEVQDLFKHITKQLRLTSYIPEVYELDTQLKPFIPAYVPAIGEVDAFIKIPRPDGEDETLGISVVDEQAPLTRPKLNQSKRAVLDLLLDEHGLLPKRDYKVHSISHSGDVAKEIQNWIDNVEKIQKNKFAPSVIYSNKMPEIDTLMQAWDPEFEKILEENALPDADLDIPIEDLARFSCGLLDIPVYDSNKDKSLVESMHVMFTLYSALVQHSQGQQGGAVAQQQ